MRVRMKVTVSGTRDGKPWPERGSVVDLPDDEAKQLITGGLAAKPDDETDDRPPVEPPVEEATVPLAETSTPTGRKPTARPAK
ncbi:MULTISPECIES: hypothetical protein [Streptomyces]|uniref:hypothetical protein n=1 Tax=Streptomyces TaxID=1883 RepID=UPI0005B816FB|nr:MULTISPECIES: hypothetical protein [Streptomyces]MDP9949126.1 hypothetical protein [Streptomyces sp. DSM 41269]